MKDNWLGGDQILGEGSFVEAILKEADEIDEQKELFKKEAKNLEQYLIVEKKRWTILF